MRLDDISTEESLFQPRGGLDHDHVETLRKARKISGDLDPILVIQVGPRTILIDGHHRLEGYARDARKSGKQDAATIPVEHFRGSLEDALDQAGMENTKTRRAMTSEERHDYAWRRVVLGIGSKSKIARVSGVSERTVTTMRAARDKINAGLGAMSNAKAGYYGTWKDARRAVQEDTSGPTEDYDEAMDRKAKEIAEQLYKKFGTAFTRSPKMTARVLEIMFGDRVGEVQHELREIVSGDAEEDEEDAD